MIGTKLVGRVVDPGPDLQPMTFDDIGRGPDGIIHTADDVFKLPVAHAKVYVLGREDQFVYTDADGLFELDGIPSGTVKVSIDGRTSTNAPEGVFFPEMVMSAEIRPGVSNTLMDTVGSAESKAANAGRLEVYLPRVPLASLKTVDGSGMTTITADQMSSPSLSAEQAASLSLRVPGGSATGPDGLALSDVKIGIATVPPELVKDMLPEGVLQHSFDITIQAPGVTVFAEPVQITFPNVFNADPGSKVNIMSFDHTTGEVGDQWNGNRLSRTGKRSSRTQTAVSRHLVGIVPFRLGRRCKGRSNRRRRRPALSRRVRLLKTSSGTLKL